MDVYVAGRVLVADAGTAPSRRITLHSRRRCRPGATVPVSAAVAGVPSYGRHVVVAAQTVPYTHLRAHETVLDFVCRLLLEKKK